MTLPYSTNLTQEQGRLLSSLILQAKPGDRPRSVDLQAFINTLLDILYAGCAERGYYRLNLLVGKRSITNARAWRIDGTWEWLNHKLHQWLLCERRSRSLPQCRDSRFLQAVKTATPAAIEVG
jgi:putative transposase